MKWPTLPCVIDTQREGGNEKDRANKGRSFHSDEGEKTSRSKASGVSTADRGMKAIGTGIRQASPDHPRKHGFAWRIHRNAHFSQKWAQPHLAIPNVGRGPAYPPIDQNPSSFLGSEATTCFCGDTTNYGVGIGAA